MRKGFALLIFSLFVAVLTACGGGDNNDNTAEASKGDTIEASVEDASYILAGQGDGESIEDADGGLLLIDMQVKNVSDSSIDIFPQKDMQLYDGDQQIDPTTEMNHQLDMDMNPNNSIGAGKQKTISVMFDVDKDTEYEINISSLPTDPEVQTEDITVPIDTSNYNDSLKELDAPGKALEAYIETIFFDKENSDYEKLVSADKNGLQEDAEDKFGKSLNMLLTEKVSDDDVEKFYESFKQASAEESELEAKVTGNTHEKATVVLDYSVLSTDDLSDELNEYMEKYREKNDGFNRTEEQEYALSKFDSALDKLEPVKGDRELEVTMTNKDGKWVIDDSIIDVGDRIMRIFAEGRVF